MKYVLEDCSDLYGVAPVPIDLFTGTHGLTLRVRHYPHKHRYTASYDRADVSRGAFLEGRTGNGSTPEEAIADYVRQISGELLVIDASQEGRREIRVPQLVADLAAAARGDERGG